MASLIYVNVLLAISAAPLSHCRTFQQTQEAALVQQTCKNTPNPDLCVSLLLSDQRSKTVDVSELALIVVDKLKGEAKEVSDDIKGLLGKSEPKLKAALQSCAQTYSTILDADIPETIEALQTGDPKFAENGVTDAAVEADACEKSFQGKSPIADRNKATQDIAAIAAAIVRQLL